MKTVQRLASRHALWRRPRAPARAIVVSAFLTLCPEPLEAQRFTCEEASTLLLSVDAARLDRFSAASTVLTCGNIAAGTIATALRRAAPNSILDSLAFAIAHYIYDRRLADSVRVFALDSTQSTSRRTSYLAILVNLASPGTIVRVDHLRNGYHVLGRDWSRVGADDKLRVFGTRAMRDEDRARVLATIATMAVQDPDEDLRLLAERVAKELEQHLRDSHAVHDSLFPRRPP